MKKFCIILCIFALVLFCGCTNNSNTVYGQEAKNQETSLNLAVEYTSHAAAFYFAQAEGLFQEGGLNIEEVKVYASGVGVAAAFTKGGFEASYMCLVPAIFTYANGGVPIKIIAGTHKNGYGLVVNEEKIKEVKDLEKAGIKIANGPQGTTTDYLQKLLLEQEGLNAEKVLNNTVRMNGAKQIMALKNGKVDAIFVPEHFASLAASFPGMKMLLTSDDISPNMPGSVLVVTEDLLKNQPQTVENLKSINKKSIQLMNEKPEKAAEIIAQTLNINQGIVKEETNSPDANLEVTADIAGKSLENLNMTDDIDILVVQEIIDKMWAFGYIKEPFDAKEIMAID